MSETPEPTEGSAPAEPKETVDPGLRPWLAGALAFVIPGAGHFFVGRVGRAVLFASLVVFCAVTGCYLEGRLDILEDNNPLSVIATFASMGSGIIYQLLRHVVDYEGQVMAASYEYGTTFLRTAGILNLLLVLDAFDIARGRKS